MRYASATAFRTALEARIKRTATEPGGTSLVRLRKLIVFDRLLARLLVVAPDRWIVKGGVALDLRLGDRARMTRDLDLARHDSEEAATEDLLEAADADLGDHFTFLIERVDELDADGDIVAARYHVRADLAGRRFEDVTLDIGFGDPLPSRPDILRGPDILAFAELPPIEVPALPLDLHLAHKLHAYTRSYGGGQFSSRVKDLIDMVLILSSAAFQAGLLRDALERTFSIRGTHDLPSELPAPPEDWGAPYRNLALRIGLDPDVAVGYRIVADFLNPTLAGPVSEHAAWDPLLGRWLE